MSFPQSVRLDLLVRAGRRCGLCWIFCGTKIQIHHIVPTSAGGTDDPDNGIPLCFNCHADVCAYNDQHPIGTKYHREELIRHRNQLFLWVQQVGPAIFDRVAGEFLMIAHEALVREEPVRPESAVDLAHHARIARYFRYLRHAQQLKRDGRFIEAILFFESAFRIAESDADLAPYAQSGNYHLPKLQLWECYLEANASSGGGGCLRAACNMAIDENEIQRTLRQESLLRGLSCRDYFYLLLQESLFLLDDEIRTRVSPEIRLQRVEYLMDILENPHCPEREDALVSRALTLERDLLTALSSVMPDVRYQRGP